MKVHGVTASHEKTCGGGEAVLPIDVAEKYMKDAGDLLIGDGGMYELFVEKNNTNQLGIRMENGEANQITQYKMNLMDLNHSPQTCTGHH